MDVFHDIVCILIETPFLRRNDQERMEIVSMGRPLPEINLFSCDKKRGQTFSRSFKITWYENYKWLCGSTFKTALFCWPCLLLSNSYQNVWVGQGYKDLKHLSASVKKQEFSKEHLSNILGLKRLEKIRFIENNPK